MLRCFRAQIRFYDGNVWYCIFKAKRYTKHTPSKALLYRYILSLVYVLCGLYYILLNLISISCHSTIDGTHIYTPTYLLYSIINIVQILCDNCECKSFNSKI